MNLEKMQLHSFGFIVVCAESGEECNAVYAESSQAARAGKGLSPAVYEKLKAEAAKPKPVKKAPRPKRVVSKVKSVKKSRTAPEQKPPKPEADEQTREIQS